MRPSILVLPWQPKVHFLCELSNATRWTDLWSRDQKRKITPLQYDKQKPIRAQRCFSSGRSSR